MIPGILLCCLAALLPAAMLYFPNMAEIPLVNILPYFGILAGLGVLAWAGMYLITRRKGLAALAAAMWLVVLLNVGRIVPNLQEINPLIGLKLIAPVTLVFLALATFGLSRLKEEFLNDAVKVAALALAAFILTTGISGAFRGQDQDEDEEDTPALEVDLTRAEGTDRPNIYWIISDEYAGFDELNKYYHYDHSPFYNRLRALGFTVSEHSYNWTSDTFAILRDTMCLKYTRNEDGKAGRERMVADPDLPLWSILRSLGYEICEAESTNKFRLVNRMHTEVTDNSPRTAEGKAVANLLLEYSILYRYENQILRVVAPELSEIQEKAAVLNVFAWAEDPASYDYPGPSCTVVYVKCPHFPYFFDKDGNDVEQRKDLKPGDKGLYLEQLIFASGHLQKICETIVEKDPDSIILLQSDHGHRFVVNVTKYDQTNVLNAVYFRGRPLEAAVDKNMINTWRAVLREQFNLDLPNVKEKRLKNVYRDDTRDPTAEDPNKGLIPED